jgi:hypothetical protein
LFSIAAALAMRPSISFLEDLRQAGNRTQRGLRVLAAVQQS